METLNKTIFALIFLAALVSCKKETAIIQSITHDTQKPSVKQIKEALLADGFQVFDYVDEKTGDTVIMQQYFMAFLKKGPNRSQTKEETEKLQIRHQTHLEKMYELGFADISGPFGDDGDLRGVTVYNTPTQKMADSLANSDPMVEAERLIVEIHPWWAAKGFLLR